MGRMEWLLVETLGLSRLTWLNVLNVSAVKRSVRAEFSPSLNTLRSATFQLSQPGPSMTPTPALPKAVAGGFVKADLLQQSAGPRWPGGRAPGIAWVAVTGSSARSWIS